MKLHNLPGVFFSVWIGFALLLIGGILINVQGGELQETKKNELGRRFPSEKRVEIDKNTGRNMTFLTHSKFDDIKPYQTHETWTADGKWIIFSSNRSRSGKAIFLVNEESGEIVQVTNEKVNTGFLNLSRKTMTLYYFRTVSRNGQDQRELIEADLAKILKDSAKSAIKPAEEYRRTVAKIPLDWSISGASLDADESAIYVGIVHPNAQGKIPALKEKTTSELNAIDLKTGKIRKVLPEIPFRIGHVQSNFKIPGEIAYCQETGGDAEQRLWLVQADGTGNRPVYRESPEEWVTHETFSNPDEMMFILSGNHPDFRVKPTGIAVINLRSNAVRLLGQTDWKDGLFWHCNGSPDGRFATGDTHNGKLFLINRSNCQQTLLSSGHPQRPNHLHPIFSPNSQKILIQTGIANNGKALDLVTIPVNDPKDVPDLH